MAEKINLFINKISVSVPAGSSVLEAARVANINIPTLCYLEEINEIGACRMCLVEVEGAKGLAAACVLPAAEGMKVATNTARVRAARRANLELILSDHDVSCPSCVRSGNCELQALSRELGVDIDKYAGGAKSSLVLELNRAIVRDEAKCIYCRRCEAVCREVQGVGALASDGRGFNAKVRPVFGKTLDESNCIGCGQCVLSCPVGALRERDDTDDVNSFLNDREAFTIAIIAPAVRAAIGEEFGFVEGTDTTGKLVAAVRRLGFDRVFDVSFAADVTVMEEGTELLNRKASGEKLPLFTSCCPGWISFIEKNYPELLDHLSSCKSPQEMNGALLKSHYAKLHGIDPEKMRIVSIMPCTAKKNERVRADKDGTVDVDVVITTRELSRLIKSAGIDYAALPDEAFDVYYGDATGAGVIFGASGGVTEAALRTAVELATGEASTRIDYPEVRGGEGIREFAITAGGLTLKAAVVSGGANMREMMERVLRGEADYDFIELMACPGGCVGGGGQPISKRYAYNSPDLRGKRASVLYSRDEGATLRRAHENPQIKALYNDFLVKPGSKLSHQLLHTHYAPEPKYR